MNKIGVVVIISKTAGTECVKSIRSIASKLTNQMVEVLVDKQETPPMEIAKKNNKDLAFMLFKSVENLHNRGAQIILIAANSVHRAFFELKILVKISLPNCHLINIVESTVNACIERKIKKITILGSNTTINSRLYHDAFDRSRGITIVDLPKNDQEAINSVIVKKGEIRLLENVIQNIKELNIDAIVLACTELSSLLDFKKTSLKCIDSNYELAKAAVLKSLEKETS